jgi:hypothetical protein
MRIWQTGLSRLFDLRLSAESANLAVHGQQSRQISRPHAHQKPPATQNRFLKRLCKRLFFRNKHLGLQVRCGHAAEATIDISEDAAVRLTQVNAHKAQNFDF